MDTNRRQQSTRKAIQSGNLLWCVVAIWLQKCPEIARKTPKFAENATKKRSTENPDKGLG
jgi:hypothetical protein